MVKNYFKIAWRNFRSNKIFSFINITGLAIGISASLIIFLIVNYEFSFDRAQKDRDRIYRVVSIMHFPDQELKNAGVTMPLSAAVKQEVPGIETTAPFYTGNGMDVSMASENDKPIVYKNQPDIIYADNNYFKLLSYEWIAGSPVTSLKNPFTVVLTESRAKLYFPLKEPGKSIGKTITYNDSIRVTVTGIVKDRDKPTDFTFKEFISYSTIENSGLKYNMGWDQWGGVSSASQFFIKLNKGINPQRVNQQIEAVYTKNAKNAYLQTSFKLQPFSDIHFNADYGSYGSHQASRPTLYGLLIFAGILLLLGCINFINLTTAQAAQRAKEIGIRKTMGSSKSQLVGQFLSETFFLTLIATLLSFILLPFLLRIFSGFITPEVHFGMIAQPNVIIFIIALITAVTLLSGFYPSLILSGYKPLTVLKNQVYNNSSKTRKAWLRKSLTVTQFMVAQAFIIGALIVGTQIRYALNKDLGFRKDGIIILHAYASRYDSNALGKRQVLLQKLQQIPGIAKVCLGGAPPASNGTAMSTMKFNNGDKEIETTVQVKYGDEEYFKLYNMKLKAGRFPRESDSISEYAINENYARFLGFKQPADAVGKFISYSTVPVPIVGVLADFYSQSLHTPIKPLVYTAIKGNHGTFHILLKQNIDGGLWKKTINQIKQSYQSIYPDTDFRYKFLDDTIAQFYKKEQDTSQLLKWATGLAILISCLGLLGLVIYTTNQRTKEIGVRKVLGASVVQIISLISKEFLRLIILAFAIASPLAWWAMNRWLQDFAYRVHISWWIFLGAGFLSIIIALITVSFQAVKAAVANPVKSLRTE